MCIRDSPCADIIIAGSDQIWNPLFPNGKDPSYYIDFALSQTKLVSYAASFLSLIHIYGETHLETC